MRRKKFLSEFNCESKYVCPQTGKPGQLRFEKMGGRSLVQADIDGDEIDKVKDVYLGHVIARRPDKPSIPDGRARTASEEATIIHDDLIGDNQLHKCAVAENGCKKSADTRCKVIKLNFRLSTCKIISNILNL